MISRIAMITVLGLLVLSGLLCVPCSADLTALTSGPQTIVKADTAVLSGTDALNGSVTLWIVGRNYFATKSATPDKKGDYSFTLKPEETTRFSAGKYGFLIQDPGADRGFEIGPLSWNDGSIRIADLGKIITNIGSPATFPGDITPIAETIINASERTDVDDIFTPYYFYVEEPAIHINRVDNAGNIPDQTTGEALLITGTTNVGTENLLQVAIKNATSGDLITSQMVPVIQGPNSNQWTYSLDEPGLPAGTYTITISEQKYTSEGTASARIHILEYRIANNSSLPLQPELPAGMTTYGVLLPLLISCAALAIIAIIMLVTVRK